MPDRADAHPPSPADAVRLVRRAVRAALPEGTRAMLAVSGGIDSMVLLDAAGEWARASILAVATFDHATGDGARAAAAHVQREAASRALPVVAGRAATAAATEAAWRAARWAFLRDAARRIGADVVATAHTRDDQVETVAMRVLRGAGARGLAGLYAGRRDVVRPLLGVRRADVAAFAAERGVRWVEDATNRSACHLRNRVRRQLLPALRAVRPQLDDELLDVARRAADWRADVDAFIDAFVSTHGDATGPFHVATGEIGRYDAEELAVLWPAIAARAGVRLDRRGTARLVEFTTRQAAGIAVGAEMQLSGAIEVRAGRGEIVLRPRRPRAFAAAGSDYLVEVPLVDGATVGDWRLRRVDGPSVDGPDGTWRACLPADRRLVVRAWRAGDRMCAAAGWAARRVKRYFADARIPARERPGWPVVLAGDAIVWIPGVRRSDAATDRPGRPGVHFLCERIDG